MSFFLGLAVVMWAVTEWQTLSGLLLGLFWFVIGLAALCLLFAVLGVVWCVDTGLGRLVDFLAEHCEELE